jgi:PII-like signaling protein
MISVIDSPEKIAEAQPVVEKMLDDGLIVISDVDMVRVVHPKISAEAQDAGH